MFKRLTFCFSLILLCAPSVFSQTPPIPADVWVRPGYALTIACKPEKGPRHMNFGPDGTLYFSQLSSVEVIAAKDKDGDGFYETRTVFLTEDKTVWYVLWHDGWLWYTQTGAIYKARDTNGDGVADKKVTVIPEGQLPTGGGHAWRPILIHNGRLYTAIGDGGNITDQTDTERQKIWSFDLNGGDKKLFCSGIRNTEKLIVRPGSDEIWGMDHGSDWFGRQLGEARNRQPITDWNPPGEMNKYVEGGFYGHPFIVGFKVPRYEYMNRPDIVELADKTIPPEWGTPAHWAPNGMMFYTGDQFPAEHKGDAFVAFHGSWNRKQPAGYQVDRVLFENGKPYGQLPYVKFLTEDGKKRGRPVDVIQAPDGTLLFSEDGGPQNGINAIYRLRYVGQK